MPTPESTDYPAGMPDVDLDTYVRANDRDSAYVEQTKVRAAQLVATKVATVAVPESVLSAAILEVGANLFQRRVAAIGTSNYGDPELAQSGMRPALDPMTPAWPLLRPYLGPGLA